MVQGVRQELAHSPTGGRVRGGGVRGKFRGPATWVTSPAKKGDSRETERTECGRLQVVRCLNAKRSTLRVRRARSMVLWQAGLGAACCSRAAAPASKEIEISSNCANGATAWVEGS
jgi:hypothetical protein